MSRSEFNNIKPYLYALDSTTPIGDIPQDLIKSQDWEFETFYPGGIYGPASANIPRDVVASWLINGAQRLVLRNGQTPVYEGCLDLIGYHVGPVADKARKLNADGYWGQLLGKRTWNKPWVDQRITEAQWVYQNGTTGAGDTQCTLDRNNRIQFTPKGVAWGNGDYAAVRFTAPVGETIKRITYDYQLAEGAQAWEISAHRSTDGAAFTAMTNLSGETYAVGTTTVIVASATNSIDVQLGTASRYLELRFYSRAAQTPTEDGAFFGKFSNIRVYTETGSINGQEIAKDVRGKVTALNSDESNIGALTLSLVPFVSADQELITSILQRAVDYGDSSFNAWAAYLRESDFATTPNGGPVLVLEQQPALTDYDYAISITDKNLVAPFDLEKNFDGIYNWVIVKYRDELNNRDVTITPDDDANLKDTTSITTWGQRDYILSVGQSTSTNATNIGRRFLAANKDPRFVMSSPINVVAYIRAKNGQLVPTSQIRAGKRIKVENFLTDEVGVSGAGLTFLISHTRYTDSNEQCSISAGIPDMAALYLSMLQARADLGTLAK